MMTSQILTFVDFKNLDIKNETFFLHIKKSLNKSNLDFVIVLVCMKCLKLITFEKNIISIQQLPLCLPLFCVFSSEVLNSGKKVVLTELCIKMQFVKNVLVYVFGVFTFSFCYCFCDGFIPEIILESQFLSFSCINCSKPLDLILLSSVIYEQHSY